MSSQFLESVLSISDRTLRKLLGARSFLRGCEYVRRRAVYDLTLDEMSASAAVRGAEAPYFVRATLVPEGLASQCSCMTYQSKHEGYCKHVAALLIAVRELARRSNEPRRDSTYEGFDEETSSRSAYTHERSHERTQDRAYDRSFERVPERGPERGPEQIQERGSERSLDRGPDHERAQNGAQARRNRRSRGHERGERIDNRERTERTERPARGRGERPRRGNGPSVDRTQQPKPTPNVVPSGLDAWLSDFALAKLPDLEFRLTLRQGALHVVVVDPVLRQAISPSEASNAQNFAPSPDREALRILARHERTSVEPRRGIELRGEEVSEFLSSLKGRRALLEPNLMQLRFSDEVLRARFDLEIVKRPNSPGVRPPVGVHQGVASPLERDKDNESDRDKEPEKVAIRASFELASEPRSDARRFALSTGAWFEGTPGWHIEPTEGVARPLERRVTPAWLQKLWRAPQVTHPLSELPSLLSDKLPRIASELGAELPPLQEVVEDVDVPAQFKLRAFGELTDVHLQLSAAYGDTEVDIRADGMNPPILVLPPSTQGRKPRCVRLDILSQQQSIERLRTLGFSTHEDGKGLVCKGDNALSFWAEGLGTLPEDWEIFAPDDLVGVTMRSEDVGARARVSSGMDWLSVKITFQVQGVTVPTDELNRCLTEGRRYVKLEDGSFARIEPAKVREVLQRQAEILVGSKDGKISLAQAGRVQDLLAHMASVQIAPNAKELFDKLQNIEDIATIKKPRNLKATLRPYQESGLAWLAFIHELRSGGILADDMGLGKTVQTISLLLHLKNERKKKEESTEPTTTLIVCPTSVVPNWLAEIEKFAPSMKALAWHGADRHERAEELGDQDVVVTSYALLRRDENELAKIKWNYVILDEAQHIKNSTSATARAAKKMPAQRRLALTGTPIENRLSEIWSILDFVSPGLLGDLNRFEQKYAGPIDKGDSKIAARLRATIHPFVLRRTKEEVAKDLPAKIEIEQQVELSQEQLKLYNQVLQEVRTSVLGEVERVGVAKAQIQILAALTRLRQVACDPRLLGLPREFSHDDSGKLVALRELVSEAHEGGHRVLVFSQFVSMLSLIRKALDEDGIRYEYLDGSTKNRAERVERFQTDPTVTVFLISLKAGGVGLNLTGADTVVHFDPWWNPAVEEQATARSHRIGQTKVVTAYKLFAKGTIEEKIFQLAHKKRDLVESVLSEDVGGSKKLTRQDIEELFGAS